MCSKIPNKQFCKKYVKQLADLGCKAPEGKIFVDMVFSFAKSGYMDQAKRFVQKMGECAAYRDLTADEVKEYEDFA